MGNAWIDKSKVTARGGVPELYVDGIRTAPLWYALSDIPAAKAWKPCSQRGIRNFASCGIHIVCVDADLHEGWKEDGSVDPHFLYRALSAALEANPRAKIVVRLHLNAPYWWLHKYPEEHIVYCGRGEDGAFTALPTTDAGGYGDRTIARNLPNEIRASMASQQWIADTCAALDSLCRQVKAHPLGEALIGIQVAYGHAGEWHFWPADPALMVDFSQPMEALFHRILREKYEDEATLRCFYGEEATFDTVKMATPEEMATVGGLLDPAEHAAVIDTRRTHSYAAAEAICRFCESIKRSWGEGILAGSFYGYFFFVGGYTAAHFEVGKVFSNPYVDFLAAPCAYTHNKRSGNLNMIRYVAESCRLHGMLMLSEMDQGYRSVNRSLEEGLYVCESEEEYASILRRNIMENILLGHGAWYYDHRIIPSSIYEKEEYWNNEERLDAIRTIQRTCEGLLQKPYRKTTDVLVVVDTESRYHCNVDSCSFPFVDALGKSGAGFDRMFLCDLDTCDLSAYRCIVFADCSVLSRQQYDIVCRLAEEGKHTLLFLGQFAQIVDRKKWGDEGLFRFFGGQPVDAYLDAALPEGKVGYMSRAVTDPAFYREVFRRAGAHIYTEDGQAVIADNELVMVHSREMPKTVLHLHCGDVELENPKFQTVVYNTFTGERIL